MYYVCYRLCVLIVCPSKNLSNEVYRQNVVHLFGQTKLYKQEAYVSVGQMKHLHLSRLDAYKIIFYILLLNTSKSNIGFVELCAPFYLLLKIVKCQIIRCSKLSASSLKTCGLILKTNDKATQL